ncbi:MAG: ATP-binding cassette domain-containing protein [Halanaerobiales bacterium]|nr:ATP-binding cassette domain-containing protein [Halanaerobiales bacterium]
MKIMQVSNLKKYFYNKDGLLNKMIGNGPQIIQAVQDVSFHINSGNIMALVGESGCGKTTVARLILNLIQADQGDIKFKTESIYRMNKARI